MSPGRLIMRHDMHPLSLHQVMFLPTIKGQAEANQLNRWLPLAAARGIIGTYAQTELGHGTNLKKLETTATYDAKTEEFILHSPTITSAKSVEQAAARKLKATPLLLNVEKDGTFIAPKHSKLSYGTMIFVRSVMIKDQATFLAEAVCIAIRYSAIRRQGEIESEAGEVQILDYQTQQYRLFPQLARAFAFMFAGYKIRDLYVKVSKQLTEGKVDLLPEIHALSSGLKAVITWETAQGIEQCRLACGGHGYSLASALPDIYTFAVAGCTYEGENIVLLLQVARFLMKAAKKVRVGSTRLVTVCEYLAKPVSAHCRFNSCSNYSNSDILHDFENIARKQVFRAYDDLKRHQKESTLEEGWNRASVELCKASRMHIRLYLVRVFLEKVATATDASIRSPLTDLAKLYVFDLITTCQGDFLKDGFMSSVQSDEIHQGIYCCLERLRPNAVSLVDSWDFDDLELHSVLGRRDGNVYPALFE
ncbi:hypothetical protein KIN20_033660 [Parelaphostrongylus tenuis]|uniref:Acyl-coenzyme A oxidase n=1 Tax=Parelaphostrongylus tenuis TaxID=148309 RepID=A0AAD5WIF4_PARTN|nr:hypothetical protein KIN20_033660 [Parelaphostrongylus tenuis]